jgi:hypothetical protein
MNILLPGFKPFNRKELETIPGKWLLQRTISQVLYRLRDEWDGLDVDSRNYSLDLY